MIYENVVLTLLFLLVFLNTLQALRKARQTVKRAEAPAEAEVKEPDDRTRDKFNEGFENIMTFSVDGRDGFGEG